MRPFLKKPEESLECCRRDRARRQVADKPADDEGEIPVQKPGVPEHEEVTEPADRAEPGPLPEPPDEETEEERDDGDGNDRNIL